MKHAYIAPINYLNHIPIHKDGDIHLLLAHLLTDKAYCEYYINRKEKYGDLIIVDNGAFEFKKPLSAPELYKLINQSGIKPDIVVAPDYPFEDWKKTVESTMDFSDEYKSYFDETVKIMAVPQSKKGDWKGWLQGYLMMSNIDNVVMMGMSILGVPNAFCSLTKTEDISFNRTFATSFLIRNNLIQEHIMHHYLGCSDPRELLMMKTQGVAFSNDSSTAFWHGINDIIFDETRSGLANGKVNKSVDFFIDFDEKKINAIERNISWVEDLLENIAEK